MLTREVIFEILWLIMFCMTLWGMLNHKEIIKAWVHQNDRVMHSSHLGCWQVWRTLPGLAHTLFAGLNGRSRAAFHLWPSILLARCSR